MRDLKGKWALVTGANRGLGYRITKFMASQGCNLILHSRDLKHTEKVYEEVTAMGVDAYCIAAELSKPEQVQAMIDAIKKKGTQIDILFNDAAVQIAYRTEYFTTPVSDYTESFMINTIAPMMLCYAFMPPMIERGFGRIINTTSGIQNEPQQAGYSASKAALDKVTKDLGTTVEGTDVMINLVDPGWCRTDLGGPKAPNDPDSVIPGMVLGAFADDKKSGRWISAQDYAGMTLEAALKKFENK
ncbi:MAG: SDR family oxidoreductase [Paludibacteraceae bacterium]|nr:SDR family oxidoreductase [Paludibacteraceae bacterium]MBR5972251.1 SDR family oxidoreductase [Paludibacteraceae bacterium]